METSTKFGLLAIVASIFIGIGIGVLTPLPLEWGFIVIAVLFALQGVHPLMTPITLYFALIVASGELARFGVDAAQYTVALASQYPVPTVSIAISGVLIPIYLVLWGQWMLQTLSGGYSE